MIQPADLIITNAKCFTADPGQPRAEAMAVQANRIALVGSAQEVEALRGPRTRVVDGQGGTLIPGFIDSHYHLLTSSLELDHADLSQVSTPRELTAAIGEYTRRNLDRQWLIGVGLPYQVLPNNQPLTRHHLDALVADRPLIVFAYDAHTVWANTEALRRANLLQGKQTVGPNSQIVMGEDGLATGELREMGAYHHVLALLPAASDPEKRRLLRIGLQQAAELGITSVHNMDGDAQQLAFYSTLDDLGELTLRVYCPLSVKPDTPPEALAEAVAMRRACQGDKVRGGCAKFFMDGVVESYTALLLDDYADRPGYRGDANFTVEHFAQMATEADRLGLQIFVHATGDGAVRRTLDGFEAAQLANGHRDSRHRVEHVELVHPHDMPRFAELGVIASMQPLHAPQTAHSTDVWPTRVGPARWDRSFAWQSLRQAGARLVFGSDWSVVSQNPLLGLHAALNRQPWSPNGLDQRQTLTDALHAYTRDAAYAGVQEHNVGQLRAGMLADAVLLSHDLFATPAESIDQVRPVLTLCDGNIIFDARS